MMKDKLFNDKLEIEVNLVGYDSQGESIVFFIKIDGGVDFVGVVDSYYQGTFNKTLELLKVVGKCDFLCWTHAHVDHSKGISKIIQQFCDETSLIYITPVIHSHLCSDDDSLAKEVEAVKGLFSAEGKINGKSYKVSRVSEAQLLYRSLYLCNDRRYSIKIESFCPNDYQLTQRDFLGKNNDSNISSIGLNIEACILGSYQPTYNIILAGDVEDRALKNLSEFIEPFKHPTYIKIPHHASPSARCMLDLLKTEDVSNLQVAATTVYDRHELPDKNVLRCYKQITDNRVNIYITKDIGEKSNNRHKYGIVRTVFDVCDNFGQGVESYTEGDAVMWQ